MGDKKKWKTLAKAREEKEQDGICCLHCGCRDLLVSRTAPKNGRIRRTRICRHCGKRRITFEE